MATAKQLDDIRECPICTEVYNDPRVLPCGHTYCLKCIEAWSKDKRSRDNMVCPLCRKVFTKTVGELGKYMFVANLEQTKELSNVENKASLLCEACTYSGGKESESEVQNAASVYCVECQLKLCRNCERGHKAIKVTRSHQLVRIAEKIDVATLPVPPNTDDQDPDENRKPCFGCSSSICMMCRSEACRCSHVNEVDSVATGFERCRTMSQRLDKERADFSEQVTKTNAEIGAKAEQLRAMVDLHEQQLKTQLESMNRKRMKEIGSLREEVEIQLLSMESNKKYVDEVREKGTACDVASDLHDRADELWISCSGIERALAELGQAEVTFTSSDFVTNDVNKTMGQLRLIVTGGKIIINFIFVLHRLLMQSGVLTRISSRQRSGANPPSCPPCLCE